MSLSLTYYHGKVKVSVSEYKGSICQVTFHIPQVRCLHTYLMLVLSCGLRLLEEWIVLNIQNLQMQSLNSLLKRYILL